MKDRTTWVVAAVALGLAAFAWWRGGASLTLSGLTAGGRALLGVIPLLIAAFLIAGLIRALVSEETVSHWLGSASGWRGIALGCLAGALIPGGPYVYYPIAATLLGAGASLGVLVAFVTAKNLWSVTRLPLEFGLLGPHLTLVRIGVTIIMPPLLGFVTEKLFGGMVEQVREGMPS
jgi:uncharacterized membrane protein YraQ (UPF0718 family)